MKKFILVALLVTTVLLTGCSKKEIKEVIESQQTENHDFRNVNWGDDIETVKKSEKINPSQETQNSLVYKVSVANESNVLLVYNFDLNGKLYNGSYGFDYSTNSGQDIKRYDILKESLSEIYGKPNKDGISKISTLADNPYISTEESLERGYIEYSTMWVNDKTGVVLNMSSKNYKTLTSIIYIDVNNLIDTKTDKNGL